MTPLGWPVEPEVNRILATVAGPTFACAASTAAVGRASRSSVKGVIGRSLAGLAVNATSTSCGTGAAVGGEDETRRQNLDDRLQLLEVARDQRIGHRDRRVGHAHMHGR